MVLKVRDITQKITRLCDMTYFLFVSWFGLLFVLTVFI